ncbi:MAG TPA: ATP-binding cassette domain-containing protein [Verrucomicrobiae bacterium]|nr:ATP-binding cassette domain-containing protein [Verrucomicrobiae bacterium]
MAEAAAPVIQFRDVEYCRGESIILRNLTFSMQPGETLVLLGRSGSGKTTALKLVNRLLEPYSGEVLVEGRATTGWNPILLRRRIGYVIQEVGLFPHFTVEKNVGLIPGLEKWPAQRKAERVDEMLRTVGLEPAQFAHRYPHELSGGQRQRAGVARALAGDPPILLMDEPFGALDPLTRAEVQDEFLAIQRKLAKTIIFVTHDVREALLFGTRIALLENGSLAGIYAPQEFLRAADPPAAAYVATLQKSPIPIPQQRGIS